MGVLNGKIKRIICVVLCFAACVFCFAFKGFSAGYVEGDAEEYISDYDSSSLKIRSAENEESAILADNDEYYGNFFAIFLMIVVSASLGMVILNFKKEGLEKQNK
jgi:hypothetical protein